MNTQRQPQHQLCRPRFLQIATLLFSLIFVWAGHASAQPIAPPNANGVFCVRAFEDSNNNSIYDPNEFTLRGGISVNLLEVNGIVVASALLENSPQSQRERGIVCFEGLTSGQYSIEVVSADFQATTANVMTDFIMADGPPVVMDFGAHRIAVNPVTEIVEEGITEQQVMRIVVSLAGAVVVIVVMSILGFFIYLIGYRRRLETAVAMDDYYRRPPTATSTQGMRPVSSTTDTGEYRSQR